LSGSKADCYRVTTAPWAASARYCIYAAHGFVSSFLAKQTGFGDEDLEMLWQAREQTFEHDRSAARGEMAMRGLYVFKHDSELASAFGDYTGSVDEAAMPEGGTLIKRV
jgi:CRISPR-associated protein Csd2